MWQAEQLAALNEFKRNNSSLFSGYFSTINDQVGELLQKANESGKMEQEAKILEAIREGWSTAKPGNHLQGAFFKINDRKMKALITATKSDLAKAEHAMLRQANDIYRKTIYNTQVFYNSGAGTLQQCVDMATKDFLSKGITCVEYANGAMVGIDSYSRMALRTAQTRAYLQGESTKRDEWGVNTVIVNKRGVACPKCLKWVGKVYYDDVYGSTPVKDDKYPRLSTAIAGGLYHPNCKDIHTTYFEGISTKPKPMTQAQVDEANRVYALEQRQRYNERMIRKYKRLSEGSIDPENKAKYEAKLTAWQTEQRKFISANSDVLKRRPELEKVFKLPDNLQYGSNSYDFSQDVDDTIKHEHTWVETIIKPPTCEDPGEKEIRCSECGEVKETVKIPALSHEWIEAGIIDSPTCTDPGVRLWKCARCGAEKEEIIPATGHTWGPNVVVQPECKTEGYTYHTCIVCGKNEIILGSNIPALGHDYGEWTITKQPTTATIGKKTRVCKRCGYKQYYDIPKLKAQSVSAQVQALQASISQLQGDIDVLNQTSYSGIWKDPVTVSDYPIKKQAIAAKKQYFSDQLSLAIDPTDQAKWQQLLDLTDEYDIKGKEYETLLAAKQKNQDALDLLQPKSTPFTPDAYSKARKDAAIWSDDKAYVDGKIRAKTGEVWRNASAAERNAAYEYTAGSGSFNRPLRGYEGGWGKYNYKGPGKVDLDYEGSGKDIEHLTKLIDKSTYDEDMWLQRGCSTEGVAGFFGIDESNLRSMSQAELEKALLGEVREDLAFMSTGAAKGQGFGGDFCFNIYAPKGTKMLYCEPFSAYSGDGGKSWNGIKSQAYFGSEFEMLIQRGTKYKITKIEKSAYKVYVDMEVVGQI